MVVLHVAYIIILGDRSAVSTSDDALSLPQMNIWLTISTGMNSDKASLFGSIEEKTTKF
jgi:hypothetical protein